MRCIVCKIPSDEIELFKGIQVDGMVMVCKACAEKEGIPIIKKPSESQLNKADERYTVRERMERMSGMRDTTEISNDQMVTQGNLARLRMPAPKQQHEDVLDNYYWTLNIERQRKKLSVNQLAEKMQVTPSIIQGVEKGRLPENFEDLFIKLEAYLGIKLLKNHKKQISFTRTVDEQNEILEDVRRKMGAPKSTEEYKEEREEFKEKLSKGDIDFSRRRDLSNVTLNELVEMKKKREKSAIIKKVKAEEEAMLGDDLDIDVDLELDDDLLL